MITFEEKGSYEVHEKGWGREIWFENNCDFCCKKLIFDKKFAKCSMHFHERKREIFICEKGLFEIKGIDLTKGEEYSIVLEEGDKVFIEPLEPHQMIALKDDSVLLEVSTEHFEEDSYRIWGGDSQK